MDEIAFEANVDGAQTDNECWTSDPNNLSEELKFAILVFIRNLPLQNAFYASS